MGNTQAAGQPTIPHCELIENNSLSQKHILGLKTWAPKIDKILGACRMITPLPPPAPTLIAALVRKPYYMSPRYTIFCSCSWRWSQKFCTMFEISRNLSQFLHNNLRWSKLSIRVGLSQKRFTMLEENIRFELDKMLPRYRNEEMNL